MSRDPHRRTLCPASQGQPSLACRLGQPVTLCLGSSRTGGCFVNHLLPRSSYCVRPTVYTAAVVFKRTDGFPLFLFFSFFSFSFFEGKKNYFKKWKNWRGEPCSPVSWTSSNNTKEKERKRNQEIMHTHTRFFCVYTYPYPDKRSLGRQWIRWARALPPFHTNGHSTQRLSGQFRPPATAASWAKPLLMTSGPNG